MDRPTVAEFQSLAEAELRLLVSDLLRAEGLKLRAPERVSGSPEVRTSEPIIVEDQEDAPQLIEVHRSQGTALGGLSLPSLAARARHLEISDVTVYLSGVVDADRMSALESVAERMKSGTGVAFEFVDAEQLADRVAHHSKLMSRYFPSEADAALAGAEQDIPAGLIRLAYAVAPKPREHGRASAVSERLRLVWTVAVVAALIWDPVAVSPCQARWIGGIGLGAILIAVLIAQLNMRGVASRGSEPESVMDLLVPIRDEQAVGRDVTMSRLGSGPLGLTLDILKQSPAALVRMSTRTALVLFLVACSCVYVLLWSFDNGACTSGADCAHAFAGLGERARLGDFTNLAVHAAFFNLPDNIEPSSRLARALVGAEFVFSAVLLSSYAAFFGFSWRNRAA